MVHCLEHCTGCGACVPACPARALSLVSAQPGGLGRKRVVVEPARCTGCGACLPACPRQALCMETGKTMTGNLLQQIPATLPEELVETLTQAEHLRIERIVSRGQASPPGFWYDQEWHEFVLLLSGRARLAFNDGTPVIDLEPGDWFDIPAHRQHRVDWTAPAQDTVWLAVHYRGQTARLTLPFELWRQDDHGHRFLVGRHPTLDAAERQLAELTRTLHKQTYSITVAAAGEGQAKA